MWQLFALFLDIWLLKRGPADLPYSKYLFVELLTIELFLSFVLHRGVNLAKWLAFETLSHAVLFGFVWALLSYWHLTNRYLQMLMALILINLICMALLVLFGLLTASGLIVPQLMLALATIFLVWRVFAYGHIFKEGFNLTGLKGGLLTIGFMLFQNSINLLLRNAMSLSA